MPWYRTKRPEHLQLGDKVKLTVELNDGVVRVSHAATLRVVRLSMTKVTVAFAKQPRLVNNYDRDKAFFRFEGFRYCRDYNLSDIKSRCKLIERDGLEV